MTIKHGPLCNLGSRGLPICPSSPWPPVLKNRNNLGWLSLHCWGEFIYLYWKFCFGIYYIYIFLKYRWCQHCTHLHIEVSYSMGNYPPPALTVYNERNLVTDPVLVALFSNLLWMIDLKSLSIFIKESNQTYRNYLGSDLLKFHVGLTMAEVVGRHSTLQSLWIDGICLF